MEQEERNDQELQEVLAAVRALLAMRKVLWGAIVLTFAVAAGGATWMTTITMQQSTQKDQLNRIENKLIDDLSRRVSTLERAVATGSLPRSEHQIEKLQDELRAHIEHDRTLQRAVEALEKNHR